MSPRLKIGLIINPLAGMGGTLALKGSDSQEVRTLASGLDGGTITRSMERVCRALKVLESVAEDCEIFSCPGPMGAQVLADFAFVSHQIPGRIGGLSTAQDTTAAANALCSAGVDIIVFAGGDGTAADVYDAVGENFPVLGIPAGVKMHSGVFAVSPEAAGELLCDLSGGRLVGLALQEVRDIDEEAFRSGIVRSRYYGEMQVPGEGRYLQHTKIGGREDADLVAGDIAAWVVEDMAQDCNYLIGPGSTTAAIMTELGLPNTLLGVDAVRDGALLVSDADERQLLELVATGTGGSRIIVTAIGGQGHVFGRGNQQFSPAVIRAVGLDNIQIVAAKSKISGLAGRPLLVDTNDPVLDRSLIGYRPVITGYRDQILYRLDTRD